jgi:hypothetical protein
MYSELLLKPYSCLDETRCEFRKILHHGSQINEPRQNIFGPLFYDNMWQARYAASYMLEESSLDGWAVFSKLKP